ncbi:MAG: hypothetical protein P1V20_29155, partial [Verrucomicrobiales bacterium]|nr:hypothetical protein [Verrucomicrobiales bacterium]
MNRLCRFLLVSITFSSIFPGGIRAGGLTEETVASVAGFERGILCVAGAGHKDTSFLISLANSSAYTIFVQAVNREVATEIRTLATSHDLLGRRLFVSVITGDVINLADKVADGLLVVNEVDIPDQECLRVLRPGGIALKGGRKLTAPVPDGYDDWSHPFHRADNNPQSQD